jgi:hypothetical protein
MNEGSWSESDSRIEHELEGEAAEWSSHYGDADDSAEEEGLEDDDNIPKSDHEDVDTELESHADVGGQDEDEDDEVQEDDAEADQDDDEEIDGSEVEDDGDNDQDHDSD